MGAYERQHVGAADVQRLIDSILDNPRLRTSSHFSDRTAQNEPIITTGRKMGSYLPDRYREMRAISRWQEGADGKRGRWLSEAELFWRQGTLMADWEDDCPYRGSFKSYYPTYNAMSDRQLRGYFTWRAAVRRGDVKETCLSFAYVYLYELICGIGVDDPADGFARIRDFWQAYRSFAPELDRLADTWLLDYAAYHALDPSLVKGLPVIRRDEQVAALIDALERARLLVEKTDDGRRRRSSRVPFLGNELEDRLLDALDGLSTYRVKAGRLYKDAPLMTRHVICASAMRLCTYYDAHRKAGFVESLFGTLAELPYTMFSTAVFFDPAKHGDLEYRVDALRTYSCRDGLWSCRRLHGDPGRSQKLGEMLRAIDGTVRAETGHAHPLKESEKTPRYLEKIVREEVAAWDSRMAEPQTGPRVEIDLSQLARIRRTAAQTREALLVDEERDGTGAMLAAAEESASPDAGGPNGTPSRLRPQGDASRAENVASEPQAETGPVTEPRPAPGPSDAMPLIDASATSTPLTDASSGARPQGDTFGAESVASEPQATNAAASPLSRVQASYLRALLFGDASAAAGALAGSGESEDMLVDGINEALFDAVGDTVLEFGDKGPRIIEDYRADIEELLADEH